MRGTGFGGGAFHAMVCVRGEMRWMRSDEIEDEMRDC